jgi:RHS repeat-associated protein
VVEDLKFISDPLLFGRHIAELNASDNALVRTYVWGLDLSGTEQGAGGVGGLLWLTQHAGPNTGTHFAAYDGNGNIVALSAASDGSESAHYEYGPFGEPIRLTDPAATLNPFRLSTKRTNNTTDLVLYEYRAYSPSTGCWLNRDPINELGFHLLIRWQNPFKIGEAQNLHAFVGNNPVSFVDFLGLDKQATGVKWCSGGKHQWIEYPSGSAGYYPKNDTILNCIWGLGQVVNPDPHADDEDKECTDIKLDPSCYDLDKFKKCVEKKSQPTTRGTPYSVFGYNCANWVATVIKNCKDEAKK